MKMAMGSTNSLSITFAKEWDKLCSMWTRISGANSVLAMLLAHFLP